MLSVYWGPGDGQEPPPACIQNALSALAESDSSTAQIVQVAQAAIAYIDAIPKEVARALPAMPGFDRDWAEEVIAEARNKLGE